MLFLFIVQGEGRGHMTQAIALSDILRHNGHQIVEVLAGCSEMREIPRFFFEQIGASVQTYVSPNFLKTDDNKHFRIFYSIIYNLKRKRRKAYFDSIRLINERINELKPDVVINFYELLGGLAYRRHQITIPMVCVAHQFVFEHPAFIFPHKLNLTQYLLRFYTLLCCLNAQKRVALSFVPMNHAPDKRLFVAPPLLRREVLDLSISVQPYWLGYILNHGFAEEIIRWHQQYPEKIIHVFWDKPGMPEIYQPHPNLSFYQLNGSLFIRMMAGCKAFFGTAGFESVCEAMYLDKPILIVPAHAEQQLNAFDAVRTGRVVVASSFDLDKLIDAIQHFKSDNTEFKNWMKQAEEIWMRIIDGTLTATRCQN